MIKVTENYRRKFNEALHEFEANITALKFPERLVNAYCKLINF
jgi:hypothetical protein